MEERKRSFDVGGFVKDVITQGANIYSGTIRRDIEMQDTIQAQAAAQIELARLEAERARSEARISAIKSYVLPIAIVGVVVVGGIATYMYFKNK